MFEAIKDKGKDFVDELNEYKDYIEKHGLIPGISIKLADDKKLDDVTNAVLKAHDFTVGNTSSGRRIKNLGANVYDTVHNAIAQKNYQYNKNVDLSSYKGEDITDKKIPDADSYILSFWNDKDIQNALHTVSMRKTKDGYELFNYDNPINNFSKEFESLTEKMKKRTMYLWYYIAFTRRTNEKIINFDIGDFLYIIRL